MSRDVKLGRVGGGRRDGDVPVIRVLQRRVEPVRGEIRGRHMEEVGLELDLAVLLPPDLSLLGDLGAVVVGCEALGVSEVAPVGAPKGLQHVSWLGSGGFRKVRWSHRTM